MIKKAYGPHPRQFVIPDRFHPKLRHFTSAEWWAYTFARTDLTDAEWLTLSCSGLTGTQWVSLHGSCNGRPPWRDAKVHCYNKLVCRGCGATLIWRDDEQKAHPFRFEVALP